MVAELLFWAGFLFMLPPLYASPHIRPHPIPPYFALPPILFFYLTLPAFTENSFPALSAFPLPFTHP
jgi:hypothetical protein